MAGRLILVYLERLYAPAKWPHTSLFQVQQRPSAKQFPLCFKQCLTVVQDISTQLFIALLYWLRASVQGDVSEITEHPFPFFTVFSFGE